MQCCTTILRNAVIHKWKYHIIHTVKTYRLQASLSSAACEFWYEVYVNERVKKRRQVERRDVVLEICFGDLKEPWHVQNERSYVQGDDVSCGPITCLKVMEIYEHRKWLALQLVKSNRG